MKTKIFKQGLMFLWMMFLSMTTLFSQEICDDGIDNDGDGLIDCYDPDCYASDACDFYDADYCRSILPDSKEFGMQIKRNYAAGNYTLGASTYNYAPYGYAIPKVADIDNDGIFEILTVSAYGGTDGIFIFDPTVETLDDDRKGLKYFIPLALANNHTGVTLANVDSDPYVEIIVATGQEGGEGNNSIYRFDFDGTNWNEYTSGSWPITGANTRRGFQPDIVDFNEDGKPELLFYGEKGSTKGVSTDPVAKIYNIETGAVIIDLITETGGVTGHLGDKMYWKDHYAFADVIPAGFNPGTGALQYADGVEFITGSRVYTIDIESGNIEEVYNSTPTGIHDPWVNAYGDNDAGQKVALADINVDGNVDIIVTGQGRISIWDPLTNASICNTQTLGGGTKGGVACIGDVDNDANNQPEIGVVSKSYVEVFRYNASNQLEQVWGKSNSDGSGETVCNFFDFEGDGSVEMVYRDTYDLWVYEGEGDGNGNAEVLLTSNQTHNNDNGLITEVDGCSSGTGSEHPIIVDVDQNNRADIIVTCSEGLRVYRDRYTPWIASRGIFNQRSYSYVNINDDMSVPAVMQKNHVVPSLNNYLTQMYRIDKAGNPFYPAPDFTIEVKSIDNLCHGTNSDEVDFVLNIFNYGDGHADDFEVPITFYDGDPSVAGARILKKEIVNVNLYPLNAKETHVFNIKMSDLDSDGDGMDGNIFVTINDGVDSAAVVDGSGYTTMATELPNSPYPECDYSNNTVGPFIFSDCTLKAPLVVLDKDQSSDTGSTLHYTDYASNYNEGSGKVNISDIDVEITDDGGQISSATIELYNPLDGEANEGLYWDATALSGLGITTTANQGDIKVVLSGIRDIDDYETALKLFQYENSSNLPNLDERLVVVSVIDVNDGLESGSAVCHFSILGTNDAPTSEDNQVTTNENESYSFNGSEFSYTDPDGDDINSIQIVTIPSTGTLFLDADLDGVIDTGEEVSNLDAVTITELYAGKLVYKPIADEFGDSGNDYSYTTFTFKVHDGTTTSASSYTTTVRVLPTNVAPTAANNEISTNQETTYTFATSVFNYSDADGDVLNKINLVSYPSNGILYNDTNLNNTVDDGETLNSSSEIVKADLDNNQLKFIPAADESGDPYVYFDFKVFDGLVNSTKSYKIEINVIPNVPTASSSQSLCDGATVAELVASVASGSVIKWYNASTGGTVYSDTDVLSDATIYYGEAETENGEYTSTSRVSVTVTIISLPTADAGSDPGDIDCSNNTRQLSSPTVADTYTWTTVDGNIISGEDTATPTINQGGTYSLTVSTSGCTSTNSATVTIGEPTAIPTNATITDNFICGDGTVLMTASIGANGDQVQFSEDGSTVHGTDSSAPYEYTTSSLTAGSSATVYVRTRNNGSGCVSSWANFATAEARAVPVADAGTDPGDITCNNPNRELSGSGGNSYVWSTVDGRIYSDKFTSTPTVNKGGTYSLVVTTDGCSSVNTAEVTLGENISTPGNPTITDMIGCGTGSIEMTATPETVGDIIEFSIDGGATVAGSDNTSPYNYTTSSIAVGNSVTVHVRTISGASGCYGDWTNSAVATANAIPSDPTFTVEVNSAVAGTGGHVYTTQTGKSNYDWTISAGGVITSGGTASDNSVTVTWTTGGNHSVSVNYEENSCAAVTPAVSNVIVTPSIAFNATSSNGDESVSSANIAVDLSAVSGLDVSVDYELTGTATGSGTSKDYTLADGTLTISAGSTSDDITIASIIDDALFEGNETVILTLSNPVNATLGPNTVHTYTITDNESAPVVTLSASPLSISEEGGVSTITATLSTATTEDVDVTIGVSGGSASGSDYSLSSTTITIPAGDLSAGETLTGSTDVVYEGSEDVDIDITAVSGGSATEHTTPQSVNITITDNESAPVVTLSASPLSISEEGGVSTITATLSTATTEDVDVTIGVSGGSASGSDYSLSSTTIIIPAGDLSAGKTLTGSADVIYEGSEDVDIDITAVSGGSATEHTTPQSVNITITDNESAPVVTLSASPLSISEEGGVSSITATLSTATTEDVDVTIGVSGGSASGSDYSLSSTTITIPAGDLSAGETLTGSADVIYEGSEDVDIDITAVSGGSATEHTTPQSINITITDNESAPVVTLSASPLSISEEGGVSTITATLSTATTEDVDVTIGVSGGSASGSDYSLLSTTITIPAGDLSAGETLTGSADLIYEGSEDVDIDITAVSGGSATEHTTPQSVNITITDNESAPVVTLSASPLSIWEEGGVSSITATLSTATTEDVDVTIGVSGGSASGSDYSLSSTTITIPAGDLSAGETLTGSADVIYEGSEDVDIDITAVSGGSATEHTTPQSINITITDNESAPVVTLSASPLSISEEGGVSTITATLSTATTEDVDVTIGVSGGSASGSDYSLSSTTITIPAGLTAVGESLSGLTDLIYEGSEDVDIDITNVSGGSATEFGDQSVTITIADNETAPTVTLEVDPSSINEDESASAIKAVLSTATYENVTVTILATNVSTSNADYNLSGTSIVIPAGSKEASVTLASTLDDVYEGNEDVEISITNVVGGSASESGDQAKTITIVDNEALPVVSLSVSTASIVENGGTSNVIASLNNATYQDVEVTITINDISTAATDYGITSTTITIPAGSTSAFVTLSSTNDNVYEGSEIVEAEITAVSGGGATEDGDQKESITITDDESQPLVTLELTGSPFSENAGEAIVKAVLSHESVDDIEVTIGLGGTAGAGDYSNTSLTITIPAGSTEATVTLTGTDDLEAEGDETVVATIESVVNGAEDGDQSVTATISDNDVAGITTSQSAGSTETSEDKTTDSFDVVLNTKPSVDVVINITGIDATEGSLDKTQLTFTTDDWDQPQTVTVTGVDEDIIDNDVTYTLTLAVDDANSDDTYDGLSTTVNVTNTDNDVANIVVTETDSDTQTSESGTTDSFDVVLTSEPISNVVINISGLDVTEGSLSDTQLTFTPSNWDEAKTVTVTGVDESEIDGNIDYIITLSVDNDASDDTYDDMSKTVGVTNLDDDSANIVVTLTGANTQTSEDETTDSFDVVLSGAPASDVVINITGVDNTEGSIDIAQLTFTSADWDQAQTVTVTGVDDSEIDNNITYTLTLAVDDLSSDNTYDGLSTTVEVINVDNDTAGLTVTLTDGSTSTSEDGTSDSFDVVLNTKPATDVVINLTGVDVSEGSIDKPTLTFTTDDWDQPQTVTVTGQDDEEVDGNIDYILTLIVDDSSSDNTYDGLSTTVGVTNVDNDTAGLTVTLTDGSTSTSEDGTSDSFDVVLNTKPATDVVINLTGVDVSEGSIDKPTLTFTTDDWDQPQTVTVTGEDDTEIDGNIDYILTLIVDNSSSDNTYDGLSTIVGVTNVDNDTAGLTVTLTDGSTSTSEDGTSDSFDVVLNTKPATDVVINLTGVDVSEGSIDKPTLTFTTDDWDQPQTVTVTGEDDTEIDGNIDYILTLSVDDVSSDNTYDGLSTKVDVTNYDNDVVTNLPSAGDDTADTNKGEAVNVDVLANDTGLEDGGLLVTIPTQPTGGTVVVNGDNTLTVTPEADYVGDITFTYQVCDTDNDCSTATVTVTVNEVVVDNTPSATDDTADTNKGEAVNVDVLANDTGLEDGGLLVTIPTQPTGGTVVVNGDNTLTVTPEADYVGDITFTYQVCDTDNDCSTATVTVTVNEVVVDNTPSATDDTADTNKGEAVNVDVLANDTGLEDGGLLVTIPTQPTGGTVVVNGDNTLTVTPEADYVGDITFTYQVCDTDNDCSTATVTVTVNEVVVDNTPSATDDTADTNKGEAVKVDVLVNDTGLEDGGLLVTIPTQPTGGTVVVNGDNTLTVTPEADYVGDVTFTYQVCDTDNDCSTATVTVTVTAVNKAPDAVNDIASVVEGKVLNGTTLLDNDSDPDNDVLTINTIPVTDPLYGDLVINSDGTYTYTPDADFSGEDSFVYEVCDNGTPQQCSTAEVVITVIESDTDGDGILDEDEGEGDTDGDGTPDKEDLDSDNDGILDEDEGDVDSDGDGISDFQDSDSDGDGIDDVDEGDSDTDGDGIEDYLDTDSDDDGILDEEEGDVDTDGDGVDDYKDLDSDADGILDEDEGNVDTDNDGDGDYKDIDSDDDGVLDSDESTGDCDNDGIPNRIDVDVCYSPEDIHPVYEGFSPNNDGVNDLFELPWLTQYNKVSIEIFNRWGNVVYKQDKYENNWNGESNAGFTIGKDLPIGTYFYIIHIHDTNKKVTGNIYLNR